MENYYEEKEGLSLLEVIKVMIGYNKKSKIRALCVFLGVTLVVLLVIIFGYNRSKSMYVSEFNYLVETFDGNTYVDGTKFIYLDLISEDTLREIKKNDSKFDGVDVEGIIEDDAISIERNLADESIYAFTLTVKSKYFKNKDQAKAFVTEIAKVPQTITNKMLDKLDYTKALVSFATYDKTYDDMIADLINQANVIEGIFTELINKYGDRYLDENYNTLKISSLQKKTVKAIDNLNLNALKEELSVNDYVYDYQNTLPLLEIQIAYQKDQKVLVENKITSISAEIDRQLAASSGASATIEGLNTQLAELLIKKEDLDNSITKLQSKIDNGATTDDTAFKNKLNNAYEALVDLTNETTELKKTVVLQNQKIYFNSNSVVTAEGGFSTLVTIAASVILGLAAAILVNLVMDYEKYKKAVLSNTLEPKKNDKEETTKPTEE